MEKFNNHELTNKIGNNIHPGSVCKTDHIIRKWLEEKAKEIANTFTSYRPDYVKIALTPILGLTDEKPEQKQSWCEHFKWMQCPMVGWHFRRNESETWQWVQQEFTKYPCPICGTPRPTQKPLVDKFRKETCYLLPDKDNPSTNKTGRLTSGCAGRLARIAEEHFGKTDFLREHMEEL